jgi:hypothetical protein
MASLAEIETATKEYSERRRQLADLIHDLETQMAVLKRKALPSIRRALDRAIEYQDNLRTLIQENPEKFTKPKTRTWHGVKVGFQKSKGTIKWTDKGAVIKLIKKHFPDQVDILIKTTEDPVKTSLSQLSAADLKKLGVTVVEAGDEIVIKAMDSEIDKIVNALLEENLPAE